MLYKKKYEIKLLIALITVALFFSCNMQTVNNSKIEVKVQFIINDSVCVVDNILGITVTKLNNNVVYESNVINNTLLIPDNIWNNVNYYNISVKYKNYSFYFDSTRSNEIRPSAKTEWIFGIEKRPFLVVGSIVHPDIPKNDTALKAIYFWKLQSYEDPGRQIIRKVY
jgi:hypothetical protein